MSWRTVIITNRCKLDLKMGYLVARSEQTQRIFLDEIAVLIIENPAVSLTCCLLEALNEKKVRVIFCDNKRSPYAELAPYFGSFDTSRKTKMQIAWPEELKQRTWQIVIGRKIYMQAEMLKKADKTKEAELLRSYIPQIEPGDITNREGHAAKVYFNALFGMEFKRTSDSPMNAALNYGYSILLSAFNRAITASGYLTQLGIHHDNIYNKYNLSSDLMEPYRPLIDEIIYEKKPEQFDKETKYALVNVLNKTVRINNENQTVLNSIDIYLRGIFHALNTDNTDLIIFYEP